MRNDDSDWLDLGGTETAELTESFWRSPDRLRHAAQRLRQKAQRVDPRLEMLEPPRAKPGLSLGQLVGHRRIDEPYDEQALRTNRARAEIEMALFKERQEAEQQRKQTEADAYAKYKQTALGQLLLRG
jgi:hypothetical protein